jgi:hypothetical protein
MQTSYGCIFKKKTSVAAINITLGVLGRRADKTEIPGAEILGRIFTVTSDENMYTTVHSAYTEPTPNMAPM